MENVCQWSLRWWCRDGLPSVVMFNGGCEGSDALTPKKNKASRAPEDEDDVVEEDKDGVWSKLTCCASCCCCWSVKEKMSWRVMSERRRSWKQGTTRRLVNDDLLALPVPIAVFVCRSWVVLIDFGDLGYTDAEIFLMLEGCDSIWPTRRKYNDCFGSTQVPRNMLIVFLSLSVIQHSSSCHCTGRFCCINGELLAHFAIHTNQQSIQQLITIVPWEWINVWSLLCLSWPFCSWWYRVWKLRSCGINQWEPRSLTRETTIQQLCPLG